MALPTPAPTPETLETAPQVARLGRRLGALLYDSLLLVGLLACAVMLLIYPYEVIVGRPYPYDEPLHQVLKQIYLLAVVVGFFVYFWTHGGQTLGMSAWRLRVVRDDGGRLSARDALGRLAWAALSLAPVGLGLWWCLFDRAHLAWHDRRSRTRLVVVPRGR